MMPQGSGCLDSTKHLFIRGRPQWIEPPFTSASVEGGPRHLILDKKMVGMKLKKNIIVFCKTIDGAKVLISLWDMKNVM